MWLTHKNDPSKYPQLAQIRDDNGDGMIEVNRPEEIDALLAATAAHLRATAFPMEGRRLVYVSDDRKYVSGSQFELISKEPHEASPYASVYKYSHNVLPARSALGAKGCVDCHSRNATFFFGRSLERPFTENGTPGWTTNHNILGLSAIGAQVGALREQWLKPALYLLIVFVLLLLAVLWMRRLTAGHALLGRLSDSQLWKWLPLAGLVCLAIVAATPGLLAYMTVDRFRLDANHFWVALAVLAVSVWAASFASQKQQKLIYLFVALTGVTGVLMVFRVAWIDVLNCLAYTGFDLGLTVLAAITAFLVAARIWRSGEPAHR